MTSVIMPCSTEKHLIHADIDLGWCHQSLVSRLPLPCRLHKLQQKHAQRQKLALRAQAAAEDEISWDDDTPKASPAPSPQQPARAEEPSAEQVRHQDTLSACVIWRVECCPCCFLWLHVSITAERQGL